MYIIELLLIPPPCLWFSSPRRIVLRYQIWFSDSDKAIKQCVKGLNTGSSISFDTKRTYIVQKLIDFSAWFFFLIKALCMTFFVSKFHGSGSCSLAEIHIWSYAVNSSKKAVFSLILTLILHRIQSVLNYRCLIKVKW